MTVLLDTNVLVATFATLCANWIWAGVRVIAQRRALDVVGEHIEGVLAGDALIFAQ